MNYLRELNAFFDWLESNPCSTGVVALWYTLMAINNRTGWSEEFTVSNLTLQVKTGLSRQQLDRCRNFLVQKCRIQYEKSGKANQAGKYLIVKFESQHESPDGHHMSHGASHGMSTLVKEKETKQDSSRSSGTRTTEKEIDDTYELLWGKPANTTQILELAQYVDHGSDLELVKTVMRKARINGKSLNYAIGTLRNLVEEGIYDLQALQKSEAERAGVEAAAGGVKREYKVRSGTSRSNSQGTRKGIPTQPGTY